MKKLKKKKHKKEENKVINKHLPNLGEKKRKDLITNGSVRISLGLFYTNKEFKKWRKKILKKKLP